MAHQPLVCLSLAFRCRPNAVVFVNLSAALKFGGAMNACENIVGYVVGASVGDFPRANDVLTVCANCAGRYLNSARPYAVENVCPT